MDITLVTLTNSQLTQRGTFSEIKAGVVIENIDASAGNDTALMLRVRNEILSKYPVYPDDTDLKLTQIIIKPFNTYSCTGEVTFQNAQFDAVSTFIIRFSGYTSGQETNMVPGTRVPIKVGWQGTDVVVMDSEGSPQIFTPKVAPDLVTMRFNLPVLTASVGGLVYGTPPQGFQEAVAYVNDAAWPTTTDNFIKAKPKGYWLLQRYESVISKFKGYYTYEALVGSRVFADWSETGVLTNRQTGRHVEVPDSAVVGMNAKPYDYGIIYPTTPDESKNGIVRVGGNPLISMPSVMSF